ncbi:MAG: PHB depolymerase family esterase [Bacteroidota bacterium]
MKKLLTFGSLLVALGLILQFQSCTKEELPSPTVEAPLPPSEGILALSGQPCQSPANNPVVNYTPGTTVVNIITVIDPVTGLSSNRKFRLYVPSTYNNEAYYPLVYMFHGRNQNGLRMEERTTWKALAEANGFIVVFPKALRYPINGQLMSHWNTPALAGQVPPGTALFDDVHFFREMNKAIGQTLRINCSRIYTCGFSNGAHFNKKRLRIEASDIIAATSGAGNIGDAAIRLPLTGIQRPHFEVCGTRDNLTIDLCTQQGNPLTELPLGPGAINNTPCVRDRMNQLRQGMELEMMNTITTGTHPNGRRFTDITFNTSTVGQHTEYKFRMIEDLTHKVPSSNNNFNPDYIAFFWLWLSQWEL